MRSLENEMRLITTHKGHKIEFADHFRSNEFDCQCSYEDCFFTTVSYSLILRLDKLREMLGPIKVTSGYRCQRHQDDLRMSGIKTVTKPSTHQRGSAADVKTGRHTGAELEEAARSVGFKAIGVATDWIHIDLRNNKERRWVY